MFRPFPFSRQFRLRTLLVGAPLAAWLIAWGLSRPVSQVEAWIIVHQAGGRDDPAVIAPSVVPSLAPVEQAHHRDVVRSEAVLASSLQRPEIAALPIVKRQPDAVEWLRGQLRVEIQYQSNLIRISLAGRDPDQLQKILSSVASTYSRAMRPGPP